MLLVACLGVTAAVATAASPTSTGLTFSVYRTTFNKAYLSPASERAARAAFLANDAIIAAHNALNRSYWLGHNRFSDLTLDEFVRVHVGHAKPARPSQERNFDHSLVEASRPISGFNHMGNASSLDWTTKGAVTPVKNQEMCGSCWAFSAIGAVEGHFAIAGHPLAALSVEQVVACDNVESGGLDDGCNGGKMDNAFDWIKTHPLCSNAGYPYASYAGRTKACNTTCAGAVTVGGHTDVPGEAGMLAAIAKGPVSVGVEADTVRARGAGVLAAVAMARVEERGGRSMDINALTVFPWPGPCQTCTRLFRHSRICLPACLSRTCTTPHLTTTMTSRRSNCTREVFWTTQRAGGNSTTAFLSSVSGRTPRRGRSTTR